MGIYSLKKLALEIEFEEEDYALLLKLFLDRTDSDLNDISSAIVKFDRDLISSSIHNIKGASLNLGLDRITEMMERMSKLNKSGLFPDIEEIVNKLGIEISMLRKILEKD